MKKRIILSIGIFGSLLIASKSALAVDFPTTTDIQAEIQFILDEDGVTPPLFPEDPDPEKPIIPEIPGGSTKGALRLDHISQINFGADNKIVSTTQNYFSKFEKGIDNEGVAIEYPSYLQVTDDRGATDGWKVTVSNDGIFSAEGATNISDTKLIFSNLSIHSASAQGEAMTPKVATNETDISTGSDVMLVTAETGKGYGIWTVPIGTVDTKTTGYGKDGSAENGATVDATKAGRNPGVKLTIPAGQVIEKTKSYKTTLKWNLLDTP